MTTKQAESLKVVEVAVDILSYLASTDKGIGPREISRMFDMSSTAAQRLVNALEKKKCLRFDEDTQKYHLSYGLIRFVQGSTGKLDLIQLAQPYMEQLRDYTEETICLNMMISDKRMTVFQVESRHELRWTVEIGKLYPLYIGASGKVILANQESFVRDKIIKEQLPHITVEEEKSLREELKFIKAQGFVVTLGERVRGGVGIAVPLRIKNEIGSISIYALATRINKHNQMEYVKRLKEIARKIEMQ